MTTAIRALLEKAEPDACRVDWQENMGHVRFFGADELSRMKNHLNAGAAGNNFGTVVRLFTIDTVCAALSASAAVGPVHAELLAAAKAVKNRFAETYRANRGAGCSPMSGNLDWIRLEGAVAVIQAIERYIQRAESAQPKEAEKVCVANCKAHDDALKTRGTGGGEYCWNCGGKIVEAKP